MGLELLFAHKGVIFEVNRGDTEMDSEKRVIEQSFNVRYLSWVREALDELPDSFVVTDPCICGHPIVYASSGFLKMFGYSRDEVVGKNGRMFQGPRTNRRSVMEIREAIREERSVQISLLNYRKDGTPFWMSFHMCPVFSKEDGRVVHFVGVQVPIFRTRRLPLCQDLVNFSQQGSRIHNAAYRYCRREVSSESVKNLTRKSTVVSDGGGPEVEEDYEAGEVEKRKSATAISNILSVLIHYSELTGRLACGKRCYLPGMVPSNTALNICLGRIKQSFVLTDPCLPDMPIVYASDPFLRLTGYSRNEVLGLNCRFMSGPDTNPSTGFLIKERIESERACTVRILNYRKDKTSFWNYLHISPVRNARGKVAYFVGVQINDVCPDHDKQQLRPEMSQLSTIAAIKVAVRGLPMISTS